MGSALRRTGLYLFGQIPSEIIREIGRQVVHRLAIGRSDVTGDDFGSIFADAIGGTHRASPLGAADVVLNSCAWSIKTVKFRYPFAQSSVRLISGRNSPDYSVGISNPRLDPQETGRAVLSIWNARVDEAMREFDDLRIVVLLRNMGTREFVIFEEEAVRFNPMNFTWSTNKRNNLEGRNISDGVHRFTWQPHGSQFTIIRAVPNSARQFSITQNVPIVSPDDVLKIVGYQDNWISL